MKISAETRASIANKVYIVFKYNTEEDCKKYLQENYDEIIKRIATLKSIGEPMSIKDQEWEFDYLECEKEIMNKLIIHSKNKMKLTDKRKKEVMKDIEDHVDLMWQIEDEEGYSQGKFIGTYKQWIIDKLKKHPVESDEKHKLYFMLTIIERLELKRQNEK